MVSSSCLHCGAHHPIYKPLRAISSTVDKPGNITEATPCICDLCSLLNIKALKARHINILEWSTWKYLTDWGEQISVASHSHLPFCEQSVFPCGRQWNLGTTAGVSVSLHALFVREPESEPTRHHRCNCNISLARASLSSEGLYGAYTSCPA